MGRPATGQRTGGARVAAPLPEGQRRATQVRPRRPWLVPMALLILAVLLAAVLAMRANRGGGAELAVLGTNDFHALAFSPDDPDVAFFGHHDGVLRSADGGRSWQTLTERRGFDAMGLAVSRADGRTLYLAGHDIFQVSTDGGATWRAVAHNLPGTDIHAFAMSPDDTRRLYALVVGQGLFGSADGGRTWQRLPGPAPVEVTALATAGGVPETLYAGTARNGVLRSTDGGGSWAPAASGLASRRVLALAVDPGARRTLYAAGDGGLARSTDGGATWNTLPFPGANPVALAVSPARPERILVVAVAGKRGLVFRSDDGGQHWDGSK
jgi:photosystem II stability/assembly factor-like uncharacterized protein